MKLDTVALKRYFSPGAYKDLDVFLEQMPLRAGKMLIVAGITAWLVAGCCVVYVVTQANHVMGLRADILKAETLKPTVPVITQAPVDTAEVDAFSKHLSELYPQITINGIGNRIEIRGTSTDKYGAFREAVGHSFNGGTGWRLNVEEMCVGRECKASTALYGAFTVYRLRVDKPAG